MCVTKLFVAYIYIDLCILKYIHYFYLSILIFYEVNFVARKTQAPLNQSSRNFPDVFVFTVPNAIEISIFQIHPKYGVMEQSGKSKDRWTLLTKWRLQKATIARNGITGPAGAGISQNS